MSAFETCTLYLALSHMLPNMFIMAFKEEEGRREGRGGCRGSWKPSNKSVLYQSLQPVRGLGIKNVLSLERKGVVGTNATLWQSAHECSRLEGSPFSSYTGKKIRTHQRGSLNWVLYGPCHFLQHSFPHRTEYWWLTEQSWVPGSCFWRHTPEELGQWPCTYLAFLVHPADSCT